MYRSFFHNRRDGFIKRERDIYKIYKFSIAKIYYIFFTGLASGNLWDIWGKLVNDWDYAKKKPTYLKVRFNNYFVIIISGMIFVSYLTDFCYFPLERNGRKLLDTVRTGNK